VLQLFFITKGNVAAEEGGRLAERKEKKWSGVQGLYITKGFRSRGEMFISQI